METQPKEKQVAFQKTSRTFRLSLAGLSWLSKQRHDQQNDRTHASWGDSNYSDIGWSPATVVYLKINGWTLRDLLHLSDRTAPARQLNQPLVLRNALPANCLDELARIQIGVDKHSAGIKYHDPCLKPLSLFRPFSVTFDDVIRPDEWTSMERQLHSEANRYCQFNAATTELLDFVDMQIGIIALTLQDYSEGGPAAAYYSDFDSENPLKHPALLENRHKDTHNHRRLFRNLFHYQTRIRQDVLHLQDNAYRRASEPYTAILLQLQQFQKAASCRIGTLKGSAARVVMRFHNTATVINKRDILNALTHRCNTHGGPKMDSKIRPAADRLLSAISKAAREMHLYLEDVEAYIGPECTEEMAKTKATDQFRSLTNRIVSGAPGAASYYADATLEQNCAKHLHTIEDIILLPHTKQTAQYFASLEAHLRNLVHPANQSEASEDTHEDLDSVSTRAQPMEENWREMYGSGAVPLEWDGDKELRAQIARMNIDVDEGYCTRQYTTRDVYDPETGLPSW